MARNATTDTPHAPLNTTVAPQGRQFRIRVESGDMLFSPVKFNTFNVGSVTVETECLEGELPGVLETVQQMVRKAFSDQYRGRLEFYLKGIKYNDRRVQESAED